MIEAVEAAFTAVQERQPEGVEYMYGRLPGTNEFVAWLQLDDGIENPMPGIEAARDLQATVAKWVVGPPPAPPPVELLGWYGSAR